MTAEATLSNQSPLPRISTCLFRNVVTPHTYSDSAVTLTAVLVVTTAGYLAGKFVSLRSNEILFRKLPEMTQGADSAL